MTINREERQKALEAAISQICKQHGKGAIMHLSDEPMTENVDVIPTGIDSLNIGLGIGGLCRGRISELYGPESSGKTSVALCAAAECQRNGGVAAFIDVEHALDPVWAKKLGVDVDELLLSQPDTGEQALEIADTLIRSASVDLVILDSVAALVPKNELEGEMGDSHMGLTARLMSQALRKIAGNIKRTNSHMLFINQIRMKIGVMFGNPETTTGGNALKFYASHRLDIRRKGAVKKGDEIIGNETRVKIVKNKLAAPFKTVDFNLYYDIGICPYADILKLAVSHGVVEKSGTWYQYKGDNLGQGEERTRQYLKDNQDIYQEIRQTVIKTALGKKYSESIDTSEEPNNQTAEAPDALDKVA